MKLYIWTIVLLGLVLSSLADEKPVKRRRLRLRKKKRTPLPKLPTPLPLIAKESIGYKAVVHTLPPIFHMTLPVTGQSGEIEKYADIISAKIHEKMQTNPPTITTANEDLEKFYSTRPAAESKHEETHSTKPSPVLDITNVPTIGLDISNIIKAVEDRERSPIEIPGSDKSLTRNGEFNPRKGYDGILEKDNDDFPIKDAKGNQPQPYGMVDSESWNPKSQNREASQPQRYKEIPHEPQSYGERMEFLQHGHLRPYKQPQPRRSEPRHRPYNPQPHRPMHYEQPRYNQDPYFPRYPSYYRGDLYDFHHFNHRDANPQSDLHNLNNPWDEKLEDHPSEPDKAEHVIHDDIKIPRHELHVTKPGPIEDVDERLDKIDDNTAPIKRFKYRSEPVFDSYFDSPMMPWEYKRPYGYRHDRRPYERMPHHQPRYRQFDDLQNDRRYNAMENARYRPVHETHRQLEETKRPFIVPSTSEPYRTLAMMNELPTTNTYNKYTSLAPKMVKESNQIKRVESKSFIFGLQGATPKRLPSYRYGDDDVKAHMINAAPMSNPTTYTGATVVDLAKKFGASTFAELLDTTPLRTLTDSFTVFIPPNSAFTSIAKDNRTSLESILQYHIGTEVAFRSELGNEVLIDTRAGVPVRINVYKKVTSASCVPIKYFDKAIASDRNSRPSAVGHVLDGVLTIPSGTILDIVSLGKEFSTLKKAIAVAGMTEALLGGPFTIFAPNNRAFNNLPYGVLDALLKNPSKLKDVLLYHIVDGTICNVGLESGPLKTLNGHSVNVAVYSAARINFSNVLVEDIVATNGVIHAIDAVLIPPATTIVEEAKPHQQQFY
ncbi:unnamed protein product [Owenia fusiformis]|uniref:Uncharacterized protein n=1 Tax=Owenia fusiformis TaxID=6347 RepID=A0A8J1U2H8_OWEFU|nr:unnamed protein product [Owenia fusiformis]